MSIGDSNDNREGCNKVLDDWCCACTSYTTNSTTSCEGNAICTANPRVGESFTSYVISVEDGNFEFEHVLHTEIEVTLCDKVE